MAHFLRIRWDPAESLVVAIIQVTYSSGKAKMRSEKQKKNWCWPKIEDVEAAKQTTKLGFWAAIWVAGVTAIFSTIAMANQKQIGPIDGSAFVDAVLFCIIAWRIKHYSKAFAVIGIVLFVIEKALFVSTLTGGAAVSAIIILLLFINGARGVFAYHRFSRLPTAAEAS